MQQPQVAQDYAIQIMATSNRVTVMVLIPCDLDLLTSRSMHAKWLL